MGYLELQIKTFDHTDRHTYNPKPIIDFALRIELSEEKLISERDGLMNKLNIQHSIEAKIDLFKETYHKFLSKLHDPKIVTKRLKKDIIKLVIDEVVIDGEKLKIAAAVPLPSKIQEREIVKSDTPDTFNSGVALGPINQTKMDRIWTKPRSRTPGSLRGRHKKINTTLKPKVFLAMSGGVDSSVAAALLKNRGYDVVGVHLRCYNVDGCAAPDAEDARRAAENLGIPFYVFDFEQEYKDRVVDYMINGYRQGITPNPDVVCNREVKFGLFLSRALKLGADFIATGHYVKLREIKNQKSKIKNYVLASARDLNKDQSYFLWMLTQYQLRHCLFPIGDYTKPQVRKLAAKFGLHNAQKKDSQGICFLGQVSLPDFLKKYIKPKKGKIFNTDGEIIGEHSGAHFYTIGQRHINISKIKNQKSNSRPLYVVEKNVKTNTLTVAEGDDNPALYKKEIRLTNVNFLVSILNSQFPITIFTRVRYRQPLEKAKLIIPRKSASRSALIRVVFSKPIKFVAPGQSAVFYDKKGALLGGGIIASAK